MPLSYGPLMTLPHRQIQSSRGAGSQEHLDTMLTIYMAAVTKGLSSVHDVVERYNVAYDRQGPRRRAGMMP